MFGKACRHVGLHRLYGLSQILSYICIVVSFFLSFFVEPGLPTAEVVTHSRIMGPEAAIIK